MYVLYAKEKPPKGGDTFPTTLWWTTWNTLGLHGPLFTCKGGRRGHAPEDGYNFWSISAIKQEIFELVRRPCLWILLEKACEGRKGVSEVLGGFWANVAARYPFRTGVEGKAVVLWGLALIEEPKTARPSGVWPRKPPC